MARPGSNDVSGLRREAFTGCLLGLATGDALGAPHEGGMLERLVWRMIGRTRDGCLRWTDDTQMSLDLAESLLEHDGLREEALAGRFAASYRWSRGYGPGAARLLRRVRRGQDWKSATRAVYPDGSYGNGAAMRAAVVALFFADDARAVVDAARRSAAVTHSHPVGVDGAVLIAVAAHNLLWRQPADQLLAACAAACATADILERLDTVASWLRTGLAPAAPEVAKALGSGSTAATSCPTALYIALRHRDLQFEDMMRFAIASGGDVDTIAAMAGALWGIANGPARLPAVRLEARDRIEKVAQRLYRRIASA